LKQALPGWPDFADGVLWIALDTLSDAAQVVARIAAECELVLPPQAIHCSRVGTPKARETCSCSTTPSTCTSRGCSNGCLPRRRR
jgi:hypothetical protein